MMGNGKDSKEYTYTWHPDTDMVHFQKGLYPIIRSAKGAYLYTTDNRKLLDGISSWWCSSLGHSHTEIVKAMQESLATMQHIMLGGMSHPNVMELSRKLAEITPGNLNHSFYASDGSSAVEAALRMSIQYWVNVGEPSKNRFISLSDAYHGDTLGSIGVGYLPSFHEPLQSVINRSYVAESPDCLNCPYGRSYGDCDTECFESMRSLIEAHHKEAAGVIVEPLIQGAGGIKIYPSSYLIKLRALCDEYNILLLADEIAVGFYRTGELFACNHAGIIPDILILGKALTAGYAPMSVAIANDRIYSSFDNKIFWHSHTYAGYPSACAAALTALRIYERDRVRDTVQTNQLRLENIIASCANKLDIPFQTLGMVGMMRFSSDESDTNMEINPSMSGTEMARVMADTMVNEGVFVRPLGNVVYLWTSLVIGEQEFRLIEQAMNSGYEEIKGS